MKPASSRRLGVYVAADAQQAVPAVHQRSHKSGHPLAGGSPAASMAVQPVSSSVSGDQGSDSGLAYEYDPDYIGRK